MLSTIPSGENPRTQTSVASPTAPEISLSNTWVIVPAYNEAARLAATLSSLQSAGLRRVVVVDDGSSDDTSAVASAFPVWVLRHPINCGQGAALRTGLEFALSRGAECLVTFDGDGQHDARQIDQLVEPIRAGRADVSLGSRFKGETISMPFQRKCLLTAAVWFTRLTTGLRLTDSHNGFRAFSRAGAQQIDLKQPRMAHASEILDQIARKRLTYEEVPVTIQYTAATLQKGQSTLDAARIGGDLVLGRFVK